MRQLCAASMLFLSASLAAHSQATLQSVNLVQPTGKGRTVLPLSADRKWQRVTYMPPSDFSGGGPIITLHDLTANLEVIYTLTSNSTHSAKDCLDKALNKDEASFATGSGRAEIKQGSKSEDKNASGQPLLVGSYLITSMNGVKASTQHVYGVVASRDACAEIHIAKTDYTAADDTAIQTALKTINFDADYAPANADYVLMAALLNQLARGMGSAPYYQRALDTLPADAPKDTRRGLIDQLSMAYARNREADKAKPINEAAIKTDADYPMYYYNLARIDADDERAKDAQAHLQQAWDRKANLPAGQQMPDPTRDPSFQKLKTKSDFWTYVQSLK